MFSIDIPLVSMFSHKILYRLIFFIFLYLKTLRSQYRNEHFEDQTHVLVSKLTGAYRPAEIPLNYTIKSQNSQCTNPLAKYLVSIRKSENEDNFGYTHFCGGIIIKANLILTAAHCFVKYLI